MMLYLVCCHSVQGRHATGRSALTVLNRLPPGALPPAVEHRPSTEAAADTELQDMVSPVTMSISPSLQATGDDQCRISEACIWWPQEQRQALVLLRQRSCGRQHRAVLQRGLRLVHRGRCRIHRGDAEREGGCCSPGLLLCNEAKGGVPVSTPLLAPEVAHAIQQLRRPHAEAACKEGSASSRGPGVHSLACGPHASNSFLPASR